MAIGKVNQSVAYLKKYLSVTPKWGIILGSGWDIIDRDFQIEHNIAYPRIPHFFTSTIPGHKGQLLISKLGNVSLVILSGRMHLYEGYSSDEVVFPVRVLAGLGVKKLIITNAAGIINPRFKVGDIMLTKDQIDFQFSPFPSLFPLPSGERIGVRGCLYDTGLIRHAEDVGKKLHIRLRKGVYIGVSGPNYETPTEIRMFRKIGVDAVGMSTVLETITAVHSGMRVLGISCLVNKAAGLTKKPLEHCKILKVIRKAKPKLKSLIKGIVLNSPSP